MDTTMAKKKIFCILITSIWFLLTAPTFSVLSRLSAMSGRATPYLSLSRSLAVGCDGLLKWAKFLKSLA